MQIKMVEFEEITKIDASGKYRAQVILIGDKSQTVVAASATLPETGDSKTLRALLFADAVRQVSRMPEFRSGLNQLAYGEGIAA